MSTYARAVAIPGHGAATAVAAGHWRGVPLHGHGALGGTAINYRAAGGLSGQGAFTATALVYKVNAINQEFPYPFPFTFGWLTGTRGIGEFTATTSQLCYSPAHLTGGGTLSARVNTELLFFPVSGYYFAVADPSVSGVLNRPLVQPVSGLVTFTPRLGRGQLLYMTNYLITNAYNALQQVNLIGNPTGGTWTLSFGSVTTPPLAWNIPPADLQTALGNLSTIGEKNVFVTVGNPPLSYNVEFTNALGRQWMPPMVGNAGGLVNKVGPGHCEITTTVTLMGSPLIIADSGIAISTLTARIWNGVLSTIDYSDTAGFQLPSNVKTLNLNGDLIYDVTFNKVTYNGDDQFIAPFAFKAPTDDRPICLTDPELDRLPYNAPSRTTFVPPAAGPMSLTLIPGGEKTGWRERAAQQNRRRA